jgi:mono/diheme cytochrome c family protein
MALPNKLLDWLDARTGWRTGRKALLEEPIQAGVGWHPFANMPAFGDTLTPEEITALVDYLGKRK